MQHKSRWTLIILFLVCTLPVLASYTTYYFWEPDETVNYGELIEPTPLPEGRGEGLVGQPAVDLATLKGSWALVYTGDGACDEDCKQALYAMRQAWLAQDKEMRRMERFWFVTNDVAPAAEVLEEQRGLRVARAVPEWLAAMPAADSHIYLVDPLGNAMMRFPAQPDIKQVIQDLRRLLKYSQLG